MSDHAKRVAAVLSRLPARPEIDAQAIEEIAGVIVSAYAIGAASEAPYLRSGGSAKAQKDLKQLLRKLVETHNLINSMPTEAHDALHAEIELAQLHRDENRAAGRFRRIDEVRPAHLLATEVHGFALAVSRAIERVADGPQAPAMGAAKKSTAFLVADQGLWAFEEITGTRATITVDSMKSGNPASGNWISFLADLFDALQIKASAQSQARAAIDAKKGRQKPAP